MNYKFIMASAFVLALTTSCSEDRMEVTTPTAAKGDDVEFSNRITEPHDVSR